MKMNLICRLVFLCFLNFFHLPLIFASAMIQIQGKVVSFTATYVEIETQKSVYTIERAKLSGTDSEKITKPGIEAVFMVPDHAILRAKKR